ncbi:hypothetical protein [Listeria ilorinensis]|uniref:hypothetical protein n=1 Tax=Listeria ilorinensis TaxID=2867439 RepID=UPI001EF71836|nr:hypothetical protein [Listeria ilorinensis]
MKKKDNGSTLDEGMTKIEDDIASTTTKQFKLYQTATEKNMHQETWLNLSAVMNWYILF